MVFLIVGLGNIGVVYQETRHNVGFMIVDKLAQHYDAPFSTHPLGDLAKIVHEGFVCYLLKPSTYMNLSGRAVAYWQKELRLAHHQLLVIADDLHLDLGVLRLRSKGRDNGHNGFRSVTHCLGTHRYPRLRIGIGKHFVPGQQPAYVLSKFRQEEQPLLQQTIARATEVVVSFCHAGLEKAMASHNGT